MLSFSNTYMLIVKRALLFFALHRPWQGKGGALKFNVFSLVSLPQAIGVVDGVVVVFSVVPSPGGMLSFPVKKKHLTHRNCCLGSLLKYLQLYTTGLCALDTYILIVKKHYYCLLSTHIS